MRNMLCEVWRWFFSVEKKDAPAEEESHTSRFLFVSTEIWRQYGFITVTSPSCNCFSMDSCARQDRNPASLLDFSLHNYPSKAVALLTTRLSLLQAERRSWQGDFREVGMQVQPGHPSGCSQFSAENPSFSQTPPEKALDAAHPNHPLMPPRSSADHPGFPDSHSAI